MLISTKLGKPLRDPRGARPRRHGRRLSRPRSALEPRSRRQAHLVDGPDSRPRGTLPARGPARRSDGPPGDRPDLRPRAGRGLALLRHAGGERNQPAAPDPRPVAAPRRGRGHRHPGRRGPRLQPLARRRPPRHQARQHHGHPRGRRLGSPCPRDGLRPRPRRDRVAPDQDGHARRERSPTSRPSRSPRGPSTAAPTSTLSASSSTSASSASRPSRGRSSPSSTASSTRSRSRRARSGAEIREELQDILLRCLEKDAGQAPPEGGPGRRSPQAPPVEPRERRVPHVGRSLREPRHPAPRVLRLRRPREGVRGAPAPPERRDRRRRPVRRRGRGARDRQDAPARGAEEPRRWSGRSASCTDASSSRTGPSPTRASAS